MLDLLLVILFGWLFFKVLGLMFRIAWGATKIIASLLLVIAVPLLGICLLFAGSLLLVVPLALLAVAFGLLKACT